MRSMLPMSNSLRAIDRLFDGLSQVHGFRSPLQMTDTFVKQAQANAIVNDPETGTYTVFEMVPRTYQIEKADNGDVIHRLLSDSEIEGVEVPRRSKRRLK